MKNLIVLLILTLASPCWGGSHSVNVVVGPATGGPACSGVIGTQTVFTTSSSGTSTFHMLTYFETGCTGNPTSINATIVGSAGGSEYVLSIYECSQSSPGSEVVAGDLLYQTTQINDTTETQHNISAAMSGFTLPLSTGVCLGISATKNSATAREDDYASANIGLSLVDGTDAATVPPLPDPWNSASDTLYQRRRTVWLQF